jgi:hypothetical protein
MWQTSWLMSVALAMVTASYIVIDITVVVPVMQQQYQQQYQLQLSLSHFSTWLQCKRAILQLVLVHCFRRQQIGLYNRQCCKVVRLCLHLLERIQDSGSVAQLCGIDQLGIGKEVGIAFVNEHQICQMNA